MSFRFSLLLALALLSSGSPAVHAATVPALHQATVSISDQRADTRERALREALGVVLVRLTGDRYAASGTAAHELLPRAAQFVVGQGVENAPGGGLQLKVVFDGPAVDAAIRRLGLPLWGASRPTHLIWAALRDDGRTVLDESNAPSRASRLLQVAERRGVLLRFPRAQAEPGFNAVWNAEYDRLRAASAAYRTDRIIVVRAGREGGVWVSRWVLLASSGAGEEWMAQGQTLEEALGEGLHALADREAAQFAVRSGGFLQDVRLQVGGIDDVGDYARVMAYLRGLSVVRGVAVDWLRDDVVHLRLRVDGTPDSLARILRSGAVLRASETAADGGRLSYVLAR